MSDLTGHVALITGGNGGIGLGMATGLANAGADVAIWGTNPDKNAAASEQLAKTGRRVHAEVSVPFETVDWVTGRIAGVGDVALDGSFVVNPGARSGPLVATGALVLTLES